MIPGTLLTEVKADWPREFIHTWPFQQIDEQTRLYFKLQDEPLHGFSFVAVEWVCEPFDAPTCEVEVVMEGTALFDGIRHLHVGQEGYINYPHLDQLRRLLDALDALETEHCWYAADEKKAKAP